MPRRSDISPRWLLVHSGVHFNIGMYKALHIVVRLPSGATLVTTARSSVSELLVYSCSSDSRPKSLKASHEEEITEFPCICGGPAFQFSNQGNSIVHRVLSFKKNLLDTLAPFWEWDAPDINVNRAFPFTGNSCPPDIYVAPNLVHIL